MVRAQPQEGHHPEVVTQGSSMRLLTTDTLDPAGRAAFHHNASSIHDPCWLRIVAPHIHLANDETPDSRYWTTYDRYNIERQARVIRREFVYGLITNA